MSKNIFIIENFIFKIDRFFQILWGSLGVLQSTAGYCWGVLGGTGVHLGVLGVLGVLQGCGVLWGTAGYCWVLGVLGSTMGFYGYLGVRFF